MTEAASYSLSCWSCSINYNAYEAAWCACSFEMPTTVCPYCYQCACKAPASYLRQYFDSLPKDLRKQQTTSVKPRKRIGEILIEQDRLTQRLLEKLLEEQQQTKCLLGELIVRHGFVTQDELNQLLADQMELERGRLDPMALNLSLVRGVGVNLCLKHKFVPIERQSFGGVSILYVAVAEPIPVSTLAELGKTLNTRIYQKVVSSEPMAVALNRLRHMPAPPV